LYFWSFVAQNSTLGFICSRFAATAVRARDWRGAQIRDADLLKELPQSGNSLALESPVFCGAKNAPK
jgi:hypothetical protein